MGFINPGRDNNGRIAGIRLRDRPSCPPTKGPRRPPTAPLSLSSSPPPKRRRRQNAAPAQQHLSRLESLPAEILHAIFTHSPNPHLARTSPHLARVLAAPTLQFAYVCTHATDAAGLSRAFTLRFFTAAFLARWERRFGVLDCAGTCVPLRALRDDPGLGAALVARGAMLAEGDEEREGQLGVLHGALEDGDGARVRLLVETAGVRPDARSLVLAVRAGAMDVCALLAARGADVRDVRVWREALAGGTAAVAWLLERAAPPGEVLGELSG